MVDGRVSLIIPFYNEENYIDVCLDSVIAQTYPDIQLILVDDASTDASAAIVQKRSEELTERFAEFLLLRHETNRNQAAAMNTALPHCNGEFLMWMDADDLLDPENIAKKVSYLRQHPEVDMVRTNGLVVDTVDGEEKELAKDKDKVSTNLFEALLLDGTYCHNGCYMVRTETLKSRLPEMQIPVSKEGQNMQLLIPVSSVSDCGFIDEDLFTYRIHGDNHSRYAEGLDAELERNRGFEELYLDILNYCDCDRDRYAEMVRQKTRQNEEDLLQKYAKDAEETGEGVTLDITKNTSRNVSAGIILRLIQVVGSFVIRTVIIHYLGVEYAGINGLFTAVMQVLNLAELDIGAALIISMYRPVAEGNHRVVNGLLDLYRRYYVRIGLVILVAGVILLPFVDGLVTGTVPPDINLRIVYILQLLTTVASYFLFGYQSSVLKVHQRNDIQSKVGMWVSGCRVVLQIVVLIVFRNLYLYLAVGLGIQIVYNLCIHVVVSRRYPQFHRERTLRREERTAALSLVGDTFMHKIGGVIVNSADTIIISMSMGLTILGQYQNYYYIMNLVYYVPTLIRNSSQAGLGNRFVHSDSQNKMDLFRKMTFLFLWIIGICVPCFLCLFQPFIGVWVGESNLLSYGVVILFACYFLMLVLMEIGGTFEFAAGCIHKDRFRPLIEGGVNLALNIILIRYIGLYGVLLSTIVSMLFLSYPWLLHNLFHNVFHCKPREYVWFLVKYLLLTGVNIVICLFVCYWLPSTGAWAFVIRLIVCLVISNVVFFLVTRKTTEFAWMRGVLARGVKSFRRS